MGRLILHPLERPQASSLISGRAEPITTATMWIQIICSYLPLRVNVKMTGWANLLFLLRGFLMLCKPQAQCGWSRYMSEAESPKRPLTHRVQCLNRWWFSLPGERKSMKLNAPFNNWWCVLSKYWTWQRNQIIKVCFEMRCTAVFTSLHVMNTIL